MVSACEKQDISKKECSIEIKPFPPGLAINCPVYMFMEGVAGSSIVCNTYIIKGIVLDKIEYGLKIKFIEDLRGNFTEDVNTFMVWGKGSELFLDRIDNLSLYDKQDVLIMHLSQAYDLSEPIPPEYADTWLEKPEDYTTSPCTFCVLKVVDGNLVIGNIFPNKDGSYKIPGKDIIPLKDFKKKLKKVINQTPKYKR